jgi:hypothetical protein
VIEDGAYFKGSIDIARKAEAPKAEAAKPAAQPETARAATATIAG